MRQYEKTGGPSEFREVLYMAGVTVIGTVCTIAFVLGMVNLAYRNAVSIPTGVQMVERQPLHEFDLGD